MLEPGSHSGPAVARGGPAQRRPCCCSSSPPCFGAVPPAQAQTEVTLVSNLGQDAAGISNNTTDRAQRFTTGGNLTGYTLTGIDIVSVDSQGDSFSVSVCAVNSSGFPTSDCTALTAPSSFAAGTLAFTASPGIQLTSDTTYAILIDLDSNPVALGRTASDDEDAGAAAGWSLADALDFIQSGTNTWATTGTAQSLLVAVKGYANSATNNAPTVGTPIPDQTATAGTAFSYQFPATTFADADSGDMLTYTAVEDGETGLPMWLNFNATTRTFSGTPMSADVETLTVTVTASDGNGGDGERRASTSSCLAAADACAGAEFRHAAHHLDRRA